MTHPMVSKDSSGISVYFTLRSSRGFCCSKANRVVVVVLDLVGPWSDLPRAEDASPE